MSKYLDTNGLLYVWGKIKTMFGDKVDKVEGKGLSSNDYTTEDKDKLAGLTNYTLPTASAETLGGVKVGAGLTVEDGVLAAKSATWDEIAGKPDVALKSDIVGLYQYKGSVATVAALPAEDNAKGDVWNVEATGMNYAWDGEDWDALGQLFEIEAITNTEIDALLA